jgi:CBS domain containing-hemolysin-like protein
MKHLYIIVEGETELEFLNRLLIPHLEKEGLNTHIQGLMITMQGAHLQSV